MHIDEARRNNESRCVNLPFGLVGWNTSHRHDPVTKDRDVAVSPRVSAAIYKLPAANDNVIVVTKRRDNE